MIPDWSDLIAAAQRVRWHAYCPYSGYSVGAALADEAGAIHIGANVENISYGGTICAERHAVGAMIASGGRRITRLAVATQDGGSPCGICLQVLSEFGDPAIEIALVDANGTVRQHTLFEFLPIQFNSAEVLRKE